MTINFTSQDWVPESCTLPTVERPIRVAEFDEFFDTSVRELSRPEPTRLDLRLTSGGHQAGQELAARESGCCSFFTFTFEDTDTGAVMSIQVPAAHVDVLDALDARVRAITVKDAR
ncbi:hypothetical protein ACIA8C_05220 [Nocardia sp. NPDC051321]|uniref:hypothetical protein n=1 Tax=Nocardia sp. NPDC051321 TaxID=3364323 RepID=UPI00379D1D32